jgi:hypothetical protein
MTWFSTRQTNKTVSMQVSHLILSKSNGINFHKPIFIAWVLLFSFFFSFFFQKRLYSDWACKKLWLPSNTFDLTWLTSKEASTFISWSRVEFTRCYLELSFMLFISTLQVNRVKFFQRIAQWKKIFSKLTQLYNTHK